MKLQVLHQRIACGECTACCQVFAVPELTKGPYSPCRHLGKGCTIHPDRPRVCRDFVCVHAQGLLGNAPSRRPDQSGLLLQLLPNHRLQVWEVKPGAFDDTDRLTYVVTKAMGELSPSARENPVVLYPYGSAPGAGDVALERFEAFENWLVFKG